MTTTPARMLAVKSFRALARTIASAVSGQDQGGTARPRHRVGPDDPWGGWQAPHPLNVNIREIPHQTVHLSVQGKDIAFYAAFCPDGHGLVAWSDYHLPFEVSDLDALKAWAARPAAD